MNYEMYTIIESYNFNIVFSRGIQYACTAIAAVLQYLYTVYAIWLVVETVLFFKTCYIHGRAKENPLDYVKIPAKSVLERVPLTKIFLSAWGKL